MGLRFIPGGVAGATGRAGGLLLLLLGLFLGAPSEALEPVELQLKWTHSFQFAGYVMALEKGYYRDAGLEVRLREAGPGTDPVDWVLGGPGRYGVGTSGLVLRRGAGAPVVVLGVLFQHSPLVLLARDLGPASNLHSLGGRRVLLDPQGGELLAYLKKEGVPSEGLSLLPHPQRVEALMRGEAEALSAYVTDEPYWLDRARFPYQLHSPRAAGLDFYGDNLFTSEEELRRHRKRAEALLAASLKGWAYALEHPEETADRIRSRYAPGLSREFLLFQARRMHELIRPDLIELGYMSQGRWEHIARTFQEQGMLPWDFSLEGFLHRPRGPLPPWILPVMAAVLGVLGILGWLHAILGRSHRRLQESLREGAQAREALAEQEALFRTLAHTSAAGIYIYQDDRFLAVNPAMTALTGYEEAELLGLSLLEVIHPDYRGVVEERARAWLRGEEVLSRYEVRLLPPGGEERWAELTAGSIVYRGAPAGIGTAFDITERRRAEEALREREEKFRLLTETMRDVVWSLDAQSRRFLYVSPSVERIWGRDPGAFWDHPLESFFSTENARLLARRVDEQIRDLSAAPEGPTRYGTLELREVRPDGGVLWTETVFHCHRDERSGRVVVHGVTGDITERKAAEERIAHLARHDALTDLPNRALFSERLRGALARAARRRERGALLYLDLDRFKPVNDTWGHRVGDLLLVEAAERMRRCVRDTDTVGRIGGDEFVLLLESVSGEEEARAVADRLCAALREPFLLEGHSLRVSCSVGVALFPDQGEDEVTLSKNADEALYVAKARGRDRAEVYGAPSEDEGA